MGQTRKQYNYGQWNTLLGGSHIERIGRTRGRSRRIAGILVEVDGSLTIEAKPGGLLGVEGNLGQVGSEEDSTLVTPTPLSIAGRQWRLIVGGQTRVGVASR